MSGLQAVLVPSSSPPDEENRPAQMHRHLISSLFGAGNDWNKKYLKKKKNGRKNALNSISWVCVWTVHAIISDCNLTLIPPLFVLFWKCSLLITSAAYFQMHFRLDFFVQANNMNFNRTALGPYCLQNYLIGCRRKEQMARIVTGRLRVKV